MTTSAVSGSCRITASCSRTTGQLGGRAFDVRMALIEASGAVVNRDALIERLRPNRIVGERTTCKPRSRRYDRALAPQGHFSFHRARDEQILASVKIWRGSAF